MPKLLILVTTAALLLIPRVESSLQAMAEANLVKIRTSLEKPKPTLAGEIFEIFTEDSCFTEITHIY